MVWRGNDRIFWGEREETERARGGARGRARAGGRRRQRPPNRYPHGLVRGWRKRKKVEEEFRDGEEGSPPASGAARPPSPGISPGGRSPARGGAGTAGTRHRPQASAASWRRGRMRGRTRRRCARRDWGDTAPGPRKRGDGARLDPNADAGASETAAAARSEKRAAGRPRWAEAAEAGARRSRRGDARASPEPLVGKQRCAGHRLGPTDTRRL